MGDILVIIGDIIGEDIHNQLIGRTLIKFGKFVIVISSVKSTLENSVL